MNKNEMPVLLPTDLKVFVLISLSELASTDVTHLNKLASSKVIIH
jgi:hypothetical protein